MCFLFPAWALTDRVTHGLLGLFSILVVLELNSGALVADDSLPQALAHRSDIQCHCCAGPRVNKGPLLLETQDILTHHASTGLHAPGSWFPWPQTLQRHVAAS